jgi:phosphatidylserine/phosphatidylglycerophosphate/cardiolipin synthase-like enzyme
MIGSSNLDARSAEINEELDVVVYDRDFGSKIEEMFTRDLKSEPRIHTGTVSPAIALGADGRMAGLSLPLAIVTSISAFSRRPGSVNFWQ